MLRRLLLVAWIGSHGETDLAQRAWASPIPKAPAAWPKPI